MAMAEEPPGEDMSRHEFQVAYDGFVGSEHAMDVQELAPALLSFGRLIREANLQLNGKNATVKVLVVSDFEHKCFNINFEVIQSILDRVVSFLQSEEVKTARQILVDLGIIGGTGGLGLFGLMKLKRSNKIAEVKKTDIAGIVVVQFGDGNVANVSANALRLAENPKIRSAVEGALAPVGKDGIKRITFKERDDTEAASFDETEAKEIIAAFDRPELVKGQAAEESPDTITAWLRVYSPVYDEKADKWRFHYGDHPIYADISETSIARDAIRRGGAMVNDLYKVKMEVRQHITDGGNSRPEYKIIEVLDFKEAKIQSDLFDKPS
jgi:hypothetical protein